mmetsp:Transcript_37327/g.96504  ORF Transcript_37327/g.96504 Transcript_37327/m.96504 type:complete len:189 (-) Transcript_37327:60-626(-)
MFSIFNSCFHMETAKINGTFVEALAFPAHEGGLKLGATIKVGTIILHVVNVDANAEHIGRNQVVEFFNKLNDGCKSREYWNVGHELQQRIAIKANLVALDNCLLEHMSTDVQLHSKGPVISDDEDANAGLSQLRYVHTLFVPSQNNLRPSPVSSARRLCCHVNTTLSCSFVDSSSNLSYQRSTPTSPT